MKLLEFAKKGGNATLAYPFEPYTPGEDYRGKPEYIYEKCLGCGACSVACPSNAISLKLNKEKDLLVWQIDYGRCIFCGRCDEVCPTGAIRLSQEFQMAVLFNKEDLLVKGQFKLKYCIKCGKAFTTQRLFNYQKALLKSLNPSQEADPDPGLCPGCKQKQAVENSVEFFHMGGKR